jgi:hypothetical protein
LESSGVEVENAQGRDSVAQDDTQSQGERGDQDEGLKGGEGTIADGKYGVSLKEGR